MIKSIAFVSILWMFLFFVYTAYAGLTERPRELKAFKQMAFKQLKVSAVVTIVVALFVWGIVVVF